MTPPSSYDLILVGGLGPTGSNFLSTILTSKTPPPKICVVCEGNEATPTNNNSAGVAFSKNITQWSIAAHHGPPQTSQVHLQEAKIGVAKPGQEQTLNLIEAPRPIQVFPTKNQNWSGGVNASLYFGPTVPSNFDAKSQLFRNVMDSARKPFNSSNIMPPNVQIFNGKLVPDEVDDEHSYSTSYSSSYAASMDITKSFYGESEFVRRICWFDAMLRDVILPTDDSNVFTVKGADCVITVEWAGDRGVEKVLFDESNATASARAIGVRCSNGSQIFLNDSPISEITLSCGSINSPSILLRSLDKTHSVYPLIGKGLRDHCALPRIFLSPFKPIFPPNVFVERGGNGLMGFWFSSAEEKLNCTSPNKAHASPIPPGTNITLLRGLGLLNAADVLIPRFLRRRYRESTLKSYLVDAVFKTLYFVARSALTVLRLVLSNRWMTNYFDDHVCSMIVFLVRTSSTGEITLDGETGEIVITMPYLSHESEQTLIDEAFMASTIIKDDMIKDGQNGRKNHADFSSAIEVLPGALLSYETFVNGLITSYYHLHGSSSHCIELEDCKVKGCERLRVCDSSCFPFTVEAPPVRACVELGKEVGRVYLNERIKK